jgi:hypothetical protein
MDVTFFILFLSVVLILFLFNFYKTHLDKEKEKDKIKSIKNYISILEIICVGILISGVILYYGQKKTEYGPHFKLSTFILGTPTCPHKLKSVSYIKDIKNII